MLFILQILTIVAYLFNGYMGFGMSIVLYLNIWLNKHYSAIEKTIISLIVSIPVYNIGILGIGMHHIFSWYNIFMLIFIIYLCYNLIKNNFNILLMFFSFILISLATINLLAFPNIKDAIVDYFQIIVFLFVTLFSYQYRKSICKNIKRSTSILLEKVLNNTMLLIAIGIIIQYVALNYFYINNGIVSYFSNRVIYDLFFKGYSVASILLGLGIIINVKNIALGKKLCQLCSES